MFKYRNVVKYIIIPLIITSLIPYMSIETWGMLSKSQNDNQTIDQAIAAAIVAHNANAQAHTQSGGSLYNHVNNPIIDHKEGSIPGDKFSKKEFILNTNFESLASINTSGTVFQQYPFIRMTTPASTNATAWVANETTFNMFEIDFSKKPIFQVTIKIPTLTSVKGYWVYGLEDASIDGKCIGFEFTNNTINGYVRVGTTKYTTTTWTLDTDMHVYRAVVDPVTNNAVFFVDGIQKGSISASSYYTSAVAKGFMDFFYEIKVQTTNSSSKQFYASNMLIANTPV